MRYLWKFKKDAISFDITNQTKTHTHTHNHTKQENRIKQIKLQQNKNKTTTTKDDTYNAHSLLCYLYAASITRKMVYAVNFNF